MFHKLVWQHMQGVLGFLIIVLLQICCGISVERILKIGLVLTDITTSMMSPFFTEHGAFQCDCLYWSSRNFSSV